MPANVSRSLLSATAAVALAMSLFAAGAQAQAPTKRSAQSRTTHSAPAKVHKVAIQVDENDKKVMNLALNNASNILQYYQSKGEKVIVEIVTYGPGLHMLRADTSPVKDRIAPMALEHNNLTFAACANTRTNMAKAENKEIPLISEAKITPSGVVRLMELQGQGYAYIRP